MVTEINIVDFISTGLNPNIFNCIVKEICNLSMNFSFLSILFYLDT